jgi:hypothetical protein
MDDCLEEGGDGFAFVIQKEGIGVTGACGAGLGFEGIGDPAIAVEFDFHTNGELMDMGQLHVAIHVTEGEGSSLVANHSRALGTKAMPMDVNDGNTHKVWVAYTPFFHWDNLKRKGFTATQNAYHGIVDIEDSGMEFGRCGFMHVLLDNENDPILTVPLQLSNIMSFNDEDSEDASAYIGFTAASGETYQTNKVMRVYFCARDETDDDTRNLSLANYCEVPM